MKFRDIKCNADGVELDRIDKLPDGTELTQKLKNAAQPLPSFRAALQAFTSYAVGLIGVPEWADEANVSSVHLSEEPRTSRRGLIVTVTRRIERAKNRTVVINTPLMHAPTADEEGVNPGTFEREVLSMITEVEKEATRYWNGDREQQEMFSRSESGGERGTATNDGEDELARKRKTRTPKNAGTPEEVRNPDKTKAPSDDILRKLLLTAGRDVPIDAIATWTSGDRDRAQRWAEAAVDPNIKADKRPPEPDCVMKVATPALLGDVAEARGEK